MPEGKLLIIHTVGINAFLNTNQDLVTFVEPFLDGGATVFSIVVNGESSNSAPSLPLRKFASQNLSLYADTRVDIISSRSATNGAVQVEFNISGKFVDYVTS